jgi:hypothetical protein
MLYVKKNNQKESNVGYWLKFLVTALISIGISIIPYGLIVRLEVSGRQYKRQLPPEDDDCRSIVGHY